MVQHLNLCMYLNMVHLNLGLRSFYSQLYMISAYYKCLVNHINTNKCTIAIDILSLDFFISENFLRGFIQSNGFNSMLNYAFIYYTFKGPLR